MANSPKRVWIPIILLVSAILACNLATVSDSGALPESEITPVNTNDWVAYTGRNVRVGAPAATWGQVPSDAAEATLILADWRVRDPSVANVFEALTRLASDPNSRLVLMRNDGIAWLRVWVQPLGDLTFQEFLDQTAATLTNLGMAPYNKRQVTLSVGDAVRWETQSSPPGSRIINRQYQYWVVIDSNVYILNFSAQAADFDSLAPIFESMALSFWIF
ncbi:MAG: hypothetical protein H6673_16450 [Anaerolineales bacterium]|nr:hypothetical protein [Anaerolineales bacterium]